MDFHNFVKDNDNKPMVHSCKAYFNGGENVRPVEKSSNFAQIIEHARAEMAQKLGRNF